jgi:DeoR/GlpR family transcriptional regulator of sugar metabolism
VLVDQTTGSLVADERRTAIEEMVARAGFAQVADLALHFSRDTSTIRRDLDALDGEGRVRRVHGGAVAVDAAPGPTAQRTAAGQEGRIAAVLAAAIRDGETVCLGPGRLPLATAKALGTKSGLTVITNGLEIAHWLAAHTDHNVIVAGGQLERADLGLVGAMARTALAALRAERVILEAGGVSAVGGVTDDSLAQTEIARVLLETGSEIIVAVLPDRVGRVAAVHVADVSDVDVVATAREAPSSHLWDLSELGVRIVLA